MRFTTISAFFGLAACVSAANITVMVAQGGMLTYTPDSVTAVEGDVISFQFLTGSHTVTQSSFNTPCTMLSGGIDSDFQTASSDATMIPQYSFTVTNASTPLWFYCRQTGHCKAGMVFAVNPTADKTFDAFKANAMGTGSSTSSGPSGSSSPSSQGTSTGGSSPSPSASGYNSGAALGLASPKFAGLITLVGILAGSML